jgi:hypothetical protein
LQEQRQPSLLNNVRYGSPGIEKAFVAAVNR